MSVPELIAPLVEKAGGDPEKAAAAVMALDPVKASALWRAWRLKARTEQLAPDGDWSVWLLLAGRGSGKTRAAAEWTVEQVQRLAGRDDVRGALVGQTLEDVRLVMVEGESGLLRCLPESLLVNGSVED